jgi:hypothetical protein
VESVVEIRSVPSQSIDVGSFKKGMPRDTQFIPPKIIHHDDDNVRPVFRIHLVGFRLGLLALLRGSTGKEDGKKERYHGKSKHDCGSSLGFGMVDKLSRMP